MNTNVNTNVIIVIVTVIIVSLLILIQIREQIKWVVTLIKVLFKTKTEPTNKQGREMVRQSNNPQKDIVQAILMNYDQIKGKQYFFEDGTKLSFKESIKITKKLAVHYQKQGQNTETKIAILGQNTFSVIHHQMAVLFGCSPIFLFNVAWNKQDMLIALEDSKVDVLLVDKLWMNENDVTEADLLNTVEVKVVQMDEIDIQNVIKDIDENDQEKPNVPEDHTWAVFQTSGSTAKPKGIVFTHFNQCQYVFMFGEMQVLFLEDQEKTQILYTPLAYVGAIFMIQTAQVCSPRNIVIPRKYNKEFFCNSIQKQKVTDLVFTPFFMHDIAPYIKENKIDCSSVRMVMIAGQAINYFTFRKKMTNIFPSADFMQVYAASEILTFPQTLGKDEDQIYHPVNHTGKIQRFPGCKLKLINEVQDESLSKSVGEVCVSQPFMMKEQYEAPHLDPFTEDGFFKTGDLGYIDKVGLRSEYLTLCDRSKDIVIHKGYNVNSKELEESLQSIKSVILCAVVGELDEKQGEIPVAVCTGDFEGQEVLNEVNAMLSGQKRIWKLQKVEIMPFLDTSMKINKKEVRVLLKEGKLICVAQKFVEENKTDEERVGIDNEDKSTCNHCENLEILRNGMERVRPK